MRGNSQTVHKNWPEICKIKDPYTIRALAFCNNPDVLQRLQVAFPECFCETKTTFPIPMTVIMEQARRDCIKAGWAQNHIEWDKKFTWADACETLGIPVLYAWGQEPDGPLPDEILQQLQGQKIVPGLNVTYQDKKLAMVHLTDDFKETMIFPMNFAQNTDGLEFIWFAPAECIDITC